MDLDFGVSGFMLQVIAAAASVGAAVAAWRAASFAQKSVETQGDMLDAAREDYRTRERPRIAAFFQLSGQEGDHLYLTLTNYGGLATSIKLETPVSISNNPRFNALNKLDQCVPIAHGIDALRPGETLSFVVGDDLRDWLTEDWAFEKLAEAQNGVREPLRYEMGMEFTDIFGERLKSKVTLLLDKTTLLRTPGFS